MSAAAHGVTAERNAGPEPSSWEMAGTSGETTPVGRTPGKKRLVLRSRVHHPGDLCVPSSREERGRRHRAALLARGRGSSTACPASACSVTRAVCDNKMPMALARVSGAPAVQQVGGWGPGRAASGLVSALQTPPQARVPALVCVGSGPQFLQTAEPPTLPSLWGLGGQRGLPGGGSASKQLWDLKNVVTPRLRGGPAEPSRTRGQQEERWAGAWGSSCQSQTPRRHGGSAAEWGGAAGAAGDVPVRGQGALRRPCTVLKSGPQCHPLSRGPAGDGGFLERHLGLPHQDCRVHVTAARSWAAGGPQGSRGASRPLRPSCSPVTDIWGPWAPDGV